MILGSGAILSRLRRGQIFRDGSWDEKHLKEASYALRVAPDGLMIEGKRYKPDEECIDGDILIEPGKIAVLSTVERLNMPGDLVGKIGIRFKYACQGLTGLMGIQVDPFYGWGRDNERLYVRVANLGNYDITIPVCAEVFTFELHIVFGYVPKPSLPRDLMWHRILDTISEQRDPSWSYVTRVQAHVDESRRDASQQGDTLRERMESTRTEIRDYLQPLILFGIFLVAVTILGVALTVIVSGSDIPEVYVPTWVRNWGWKILLVTLSCAAVATALIGVVTVITVLCQLLKGRSKKGELNT